MVIEIEDSGPGISPENLKRLGEPFVQLDEDGKQKGAGLGLAISRELIALMGGSIDVESTLGKGSVFRVELPMEPAQAGDVPRPAMQGKVAGLATGPSRFRILIAEDQPDNQLLLSRLMTNIGLEVKVAADGEQCVQLFKDWRPDLIWMDRRMPVMDGKEATSRIRRLPEGQTVKIVAVTASASCEQRQEMLAAGMDDCVSKPYRCEEIYDCLARQLGTAYRYAETAEEAPPIVLDPSMLTVLPVALRVNLRDALIKLDSKQIKAAVQKVSECDADLGCTLSRLAENFDYPAILNVLDQTFSRQ